MLFVISIFPFLGVVAIGFLNVCALDGNNFLEQTIPNPGSSGLE